MTHEQITKMVKALGPEVARELINAAARSAPGRVGTDRATREGSVYASVANFGAFTKSVIALGRRTGAGELLDAAKRFGNADVQKAVQLSKFDSAGVLAPIQQSGEVIEFLRPEAALLKLGVRTQPFKGELHMGTQTGTSVFKWVGEGETVPRSAPKYGKLVLKAHKAMVLTDVSNDLLRTPGVGDASVGEDIRATVADGLDDAGFNGDGTSAAPKGLFVQLDPAQVFASTGTTAAAYLADIDRAVELPLTAHVRMGTAAWVIHPTRATALMQLKDTGIFIFRQEMLDKGTIRGFPFVMTTRVPVTKIVFSADWRQFIYGIDENLILSEHDTRAEHDETTIRAIVKGDFKLRQPKAFSSITY
ncbi:phage major capsid protein [Pyxidicoccus fallax]|uniref:Phage major capsid protein n=1 Tax=Pyxidicoccus fallax TaxID=394095 RepID=A0A848L4L1_9BACT|nr:phage major capsid protein [Pyxidicoccus fallax]NMO13910.1 phage major capsid protein [Pyxidicoccus fallax]NPC78268.1 phage major capsid protein [Pyxidicoccus fallax]